MPLGRKHRAEQRYRWKTLSPPCPSSGALTSPPTSIANGRPVACRDVYLLYGNVWRGPPKEKYLLLVCSDAPLRLATINTGNAATLLGRPDLAQTQVKVDAVRHTFLHYDSWADFTEFFGFDVAIVEAAKPVGRLKNDLLQQAIAAIEQSPTVPGRQKARAIACLKNALGH